MARRSKGTREVADTVETIVRMHARAQHDVGPHVRRIVRMSAAIGRPLFLLTVVALVVAWIGLNVAAPRVGVRAMDAPPFSWLQGALSLAALLMTTIVLISQNRQERHIEQRARLDLQINLLAEQKITKVIELLQELRRDMPNVRERVDRVADEMKEPVDPDALLSALEETIDQQRTSSQPPDDASKSGVTK
jgi:uncharacterized membrane protein